MTTGMIEQGWISYMERILPAGASETQRVECKRAFYAGAVLLFMSIMSGLDEGEEPTAADLARMDDLKDEIDAWIADRDKR